MGNVIFNFAGKNYIVTGASSGMGRQVVEELAAAGANVLVIARREELLLELQNKYPQHIVAGVLDVCDESALEAVVSNFVEYFGKIDGAVHAAGINSITTIKAYDVDLAKKIVDVSFWAGMKFIQICSKVKNSNKGSSFVMFSSVCAQVPDKGQFAYAAAKASVRTAVKSLAKEFTNRKHRINTISPGWIATEMNDSLSDIANIDEVKGNMVLGDGNPKDVSGVVLFLLSDRAKWITGTDVVVDGGYLA